MREEERRERKGWRGKKEYVAGSGRIRHSGAADRGGYFPSTLVAETLVIKPTRACLLRRTPYILSTLCTIYYNRFYTWGDSASAITLRAASSNPSKAWRGSPLSAIFLGQQTPEPDQEA